MCSRYELKVRPADLVRRFRLREEPPDLARAEVRPTDPAIIVVRAGDGTRFARPARFGLAVTWDQMPVINARAETLARKPTFRPLLSNRCLVPASAYFEWRQDGPGAQAPQSDDPAAMARRVFDFGGGRRRTRRRNRIVLANENLIGFAGLFDQDCFVIVTCAPASALAHVHDRMPVIVPPEREEPWLDPGVAGDALAALLAPYAGGIAAVEEKPKISPQGNLFSNK
jgi:putative SOS response-associated peptidase YedK